MDENILTIVVRYYLDSGDYNGISAHELSKRLSVAWSDLREPLTRLILEDLIGILYGDVEINPHIIRVRFEEKQVQLGKLGTQELHHTCIYPLRKWLSQVVDAANYSGQPYCLELALGTPQLAFRSFDLSVLEQYRNDPRYRYDNDDIRGTISAIDQSLPLSDRVLVEHFGFSYDNDLNRAVAVFVYDLARLSSEHQLIWKAKEVGGAYLLHPDFFRNTILGEWGEKISIFDAFVQEMWVINQMARTVGRPPLLRRDYGKYGEQKPKRFGFLIRPTLEEFNSFVLILDQMISENINKSFFQGDVPDKEETTRKDGSIEVRHRGSIQLLDIWVQMFFRTSNWEPWTTTITTLRHIRKLRQKPAHTTDENVFDQEYFRKQRELIIQAYEAIRTIRLLLANHPLVQQANLEISEALRSGQIWTY